MKFERRNLSRTECFRAALERRKYEDGLLGSLCVKNPTAKTIYFDAGRGRIAQAAFRIHTHFTEVRKRILEKELGRGTSHH